MPKIPDIAIEATAQLREQVLPIKQETPQQATPLVNF